MKLELEQLKIFVGSDPDGQDKKRVHQMLRLTQR